VWISDDEVASTAGVDPLIMSLDCELRKVSAPQGCKALVAMLKRYVAMGHEALKTGWWASGREGSTEGKSGSTANAAYLKGMLVEAWKKIKSEGIVLDGQPALPTLYRKLAELGGKTQQRLSDEATADRSAVELRAHAVVLDDARRAARPARARAGRSATGVARVPSAGASGMPDITVAGVVDRRIDVCLNVWYTRRDGGAEEMRISWCPGTIIRIQKATYAGKKLKTPVLLVIAYDDGTLGTLLPRSTYWNAVKPGAWRWCVEDDVTGDGTESEGEDELLDYDTDSDDDNDDDGLANDSDIDD
jgi:hypothetical protein